VIRRWLFNIAAAASLGLFIGTIALWVRSQWVFDSVSTGIGSRWEFSCYSDSNAVTACLGRWTTSNDQRHFRFESSAEQSSMTLDGRMDWMFRYSLGAASASSTGWGFQRYMTPGLYAISDPNAEPPNTVDCWYIHLRYWQLILGSGILPAIALMRAVRSRSQRATNSCHVCSYNLTANTSGVCPECGTGVPSKSVSVT
jgi:hypothetical protein